MSKDNLLNPTQHKPGERWLVRLRSDSLYAEDITIVEYAPSGDYVRVRCGRSSEIWLDRMPIVIERLCDAPVPSEPVKLSERDFRRLIMPPKYDGTGTPPPNPIVVSMPSRAGLPHVVECDCQLLPAPRYDEIYAEVMAVMESEG